MKPMTRQEVYALIDGERDYQNRISKSRGYRDIHTTAEHLVLLRTYLQKAEEAWTNNAGNMPAQDVVRKIAAIAVRCIEENGAPPRV